MPLQVLHKYHKNSSIPDCLLRTMYHCLLVEDIFCDVIRLGSHTFMAESLTGRTIHNHS